MVIEPFTRGRPVDPEREKELLWLEAVFNDTVVCDSVTYERARAWYFTYQWLVDRIRRTPFPGPPVYVSAEEHKKYQRKFMEVACYLLKTSSKC